VVPKLLFEVGNCQSGCDGGVRRFGQGQLPLSNPFRKITHVVAIICIGRNA
jgi:hypothetical protein